MISYNDIRGVQLELTTLCNASCPTCLRNFYGYPFNDGYPEKSMTLDQAKIIMKPEFIRQLDYIYINGNFGDFVMNKQGLEIMEYFRQAGSPTMRLMITTNASAHGPEYWQRLAQLNVEVHFCLDGLADTHHLYRQNTDWNRIIENARSFIQAGGFAIWKMIEFKHNRHQIDECKQLSKELGFSEFRLINDGRDTAPAFDRQGNCTHVIGDYTGPTELPIMLHKRKTDEFVIDNLDRALSPRAQLKCVHLDLQEIYINVDGDVSPCCYLGIFPKSYGHGEFWQGANLQIQQIAKNNNAFTHSIAECMEWFQAVEDSWKKKTYAQGRIAACDFCCGCD